MNLVKAWFIGRLFREKVLVLGLIVVGALIWLSSASKHLSANLTAFRAAEARLAEQQVWLDNRELIEGAAKSAASNLDPGKTYDATYLVAEVTGMAKRAGLAVNTEPPRTQRSPQFAIHTVQVLTRRAELASILRFYQELVSKAPYLGLEQITVQGDRSAPGMINVNLQIASVELLSEVTEAGGQVTRVMVVIAAFPTVDQAHLLAARLRSAGIVCELRDENTLTLNWAYSLAIGGVKVAVPEADEEDALAIVADAPSTEGLLVCPECGSGDVNVRTLSPAGGIVLACSVPLPLAMQLADCRACGRSFALDAHPNA